MMALDEDPEYLHALAKTCGTVYHPVRNLMSTGIAGHPDFASVLAAVHVHLPDGRVLFALGSTMKYAKRVPL
jgi:hypothetical protein